MDRVAIAQAWYLFGARAIPGSASCRRGALTPAGLARGYVSRRPGSAPPTTARALAFTAGHGWHSSAHETKVLYSSAPKFFIVPA
jgi:hypothetical protein